ncbi:MAG TPA: FHA domain-containing protein [Ktedonobacterales bacterium]|nr:FHA domain-containing protein [Ktedonobacterales bacterium]
MPKCPYCQENYIAGALYCESCGRRLPKPTTTHPVATSRAPDPPARPQNTERNAAAPVDEETPDKPPHLRLQLVQAGVTFDLGSRESIIIGRKDPDQSPDVDLTPYGGVEQGVGRQHAQITLKQGRYYIEDLKSLNETLLNASRLFPGQLYPLHDGDYLRLGAMIVKVLL